MNKEFFFCYLAKWITVAGAKVSFYSQVWVGGYNQNEHEEFDKIIIYKTNLFVINSQDD